MLWVGNRWSQQPVVWTRSIMLTSAAGAVAKIQQRLGHILVALWAGLCYTNETETLVREDAMTAKTFRFVGFSTLKGKTAVRYANEKGRARVLERNGHEAVYFLDAGEALHPMDLVDMLMTRAEAGEFDTAAVEAIGAEARRLGFVV